MKEKRIRTDALETKIEEVPSEIHESHEEIEKVHQLIHEIINCATQKVVEKYSELCDVRHEKLLQSLHILVKPHENMHTELNSFAGKTDNSFFRLFQQSKELSLSLEDIQVFVKLMLLVNVVIASLQMLIIYKYMISW